ncbi:hypothetical protein [Flavobacterium aquidurense]|uniref:hypothetical protein n=1 Tax=Flavobacterium aquidurense TaxID=362413 RepID=UPI00285A2DEB|nr:hypothetical protein [Flavobacterium aquidurense]MDR7372844.1 hypothetical protein [Flavobacterium aquidurense]
MKSILLFFTILLFPFTNYSQTKKDSLNKVVRERIKDIQETESDNPYFTKQEAETEYVNENNTFQALAQPSENSDLANYFKIYLESELLKKIDFSTIKSSYLYKNISSSKYNYTIRLTFEISKSNKASNFHINTGNKELNRKVVEIFQKYPLEKLALTESDKHGKISVQLFAKENKDIIIKASTFAVVDQLPIIKGCENLQANWELNKCFYDKLYEHILKNVSLKTINKQELRGDIIFRPRFTIDEAGKIVHVNSIAPNIVIKNEIDRVIASFDQVLSPGMRNNKLKNTYCDIFRTLTIENLN